MTITIEQAVKLLPIQKQAAATTMLHHLSVGQFNQVSEQDNLVSLLEDNEIGQFYSCLSTFSNKNFAGGDIFTDYQRDLMKRVLTTK